MENICNMKNICLKMLDNKLQAIKSGVTKFGGNQIFKTFFYSYYNLKSILLLIAIQNTGQIITLLFCRIKQKLFFYAK